MSSSLYDDLRVLLGDAMADRLRDVTLQELVGMSHVELLKAGLGRISARRIDAARSLGRQMMIAWPL